MNKTKNKTKSRNFIVFLKSFILSFSILSAICSSVMAVALSMKANDLPEENLPEEILPAYTAREDESLNVLIIVCQTRASAAEMLWLVRVDPYKSKINIASIPLNTLSASQGRPGTLDNLYNYGGINMLVGGLENAYFIQVNRYIRADRQTFINFIDAMGGFETDIKEPLAYKDRKTGEQYKIDSGFQNIDGRRLCQLFLYPAYEQGEEYRTNIQSKFLTELFNQKLTEENPVNFEAIYLEFINSVDTNISAYDYSYRKKGMEYLCGLGGIVKDVYVSGYLTKDDEFTPDPDSGGRIHGAFR